MKTIIVCGGKGTRLREETEFKPKPMVSIGGIPILIHIMKMYSHYGYKDFVLCLGYKGDMIKQYFLTLSDYTSDFKLDLSTNEISHIGGNHDLDFKVTFVNTGEDTLSGERVLIAAEKYITEDQFMVTYGDGVADIDIPSLIEFHNQHKEGKVGTISGVHPSTKYGLLKYTSDFTITSFQEKPKLREYINGGFMVFQKDAIPYLRPGEMLEDALKRMTQERKLNTFLHDGFWHSMDTYKDVEDLNHLWETDPLWKVWN